MSSVDGLTYHCEKERYGRQWHRVELALKSTSQISLVFERVVAQGAHEQW